MKRHQTMVLLIIVLTASYCFAYEVVLKNGKILRGDVVSDHQQLLTLQDSSGVQLQIRHDQIDSLKTQERNQKADVVVSPPQQTAIPVDQEESIPEKPTTKVRVYTKEDLEKMPELSIVGTDESAEEAARRNQQNDRSKEEQQEEAAWNEEALRIDARIQQAKEAYDYNKSFCDRVIPDVVDLRDGTYVKLTAEQYEEKRRIACMEAETAGKDFQKAAAELEQLLERARKAGVPPGWVDPERIR